MMSAVQIEPVILRINLIVSKVTHRQLTREKWGIVRCSDKTKKEFTRTLVMWHRELERSQNHKDSAQEVRLVQLPQIFDG